MFCDIYKKKSYFDFIIISDTSYTDCVRLLCITGVICHLMDLRDICENKSNKTDFFFRN